MERATQLLLEIVGGQAGPIVEAKSDEHIPQPRQVSLRRAKLDQRIGLHIEDDKVSEILTRLGFTVAFANDVWEVTVPGYRFDISIEVDLIEEVARIFWLQQHSKCCPTSITFNAQAQRRVS